LGEHLSRICDERRDETLRIERQIVVGALRAAAQVDERTLGRKALQLSAMRARYAADERK
jgi:hypothetical protein